METRKIRDSDLELLEVCQLNAGATYTQIAKRMGVSINTVRDSIQRLREMGIINKVIFVNFFALGLQQYQVHFSFSSPVTQFDRIWNVLGKTRGVVWAGRYQGDRKLGVTIVAESVVQFRSHLDLVRAGFGEGDASVVIHPLSHFWYLGRRTLTHRRLRTAQRILSLSEGPSVPFDKTDRAILRAMIDDPWRTTVELARVSGVPRQTVQKRIKSLIKREVIQEAIYGVNVDALGWFTAKLFIRLSDPADSSRLIEFLKLQPEVATISHLVGDWDVEVVVELPSRGHFSKFFSALKTRVSKWCRQISAEQLIAQTISRDII